MSEELPRAIQVLRHGHWVERTAKHRVTLDFDDRFRRRKRYVAEGGFAFLLDLEEATALRDGDGLLLEQGGVVLVRAAPEPLVEVRAESPGHLLRLAWHLGNRHLPTEIQADRLLIRDDHVIAAMLQGLGAALRRVEEPFNPEGGAYGEHNRQPGHHHGHGHDHGDGHHHHH
ncbi:urease accessory protein UreE [Paracraurococcus ruber]|uniref:Urease accessory protein UreE n=1 Tax=Paracraurococcus ruber TaxID=77675 RepID=A0ABS1CV87_9PROT|nr:urease accessory protein UreE [Paracraurococcus ruber]MBK1658146.1 urease accessory protein UreE [Paracraurococcus ruber]TDG30441.1 urease accessory protein UreE [Paracraurococcus ruber]